MPLPKSTFTANPIGPDPFNDFIDTNVSDPTGQVVKNFESFPPAGNPDDRLLCGFQLGANNAGVGPSAGLTGCGLGAILEFANTVGIFSDQNVYSKDFFKIYGLYFIRTPQGLVSALNAIHNNINYYLWLYDPASGNYSGTINQNRFNFWSNYLFPGAYNKTTYENNRDLIGGGIIDAFVVRDQGTYPNWTLSRAGYEFYTLLNYVSYGGIAAVSPSDWNVLATISNMYTTEGSPMLNVRSSGKRLIPEAIVTLEMSSYLDGQGITSPAANNQAVYAGATYFYSSGNTFNYTEGVGATMLNGIYANTVTRNNIFNSFLSDSATNYLNNQNALIIHAGLSGADFSVSQDSANQTYNDVYRYPGLDGRQSSYQNLTNTAGLTSYVLTSDYLNRTMCVMGKKTKRIYSKNFGDPTNKNYLTIDLPLVADVAGILNVAKQNKTLYGPITGNTGKLLNYDNVTPSISYTSAYANTLKTKRINFFATDQTIGAFLASDLVGITGTYDVNSRYGINALNRQIKLDVTSYLTTFIANQYNNASTRTTVTNYISNTIMNNYKDTYFRVSDPVLPTVQNGYIVQCDDNNNTDGASQLNVKITYYPKSPLMPTSQQLATFTVSVSAIGNPV